ncbi:LPXTG cell wall anchor domain-containing protein [uncultured Dokdonia sp.]|uniref:LPXTG cell wall anchor domain-containing protein n=1 Tax=uncultured Dokdonia sp. TaxID=575653 RepID=UPI0026117B29|nr:LPXTG cell wall anchor domain-containing protein [uncultured Dokdonia sp.]
MNQAIKLIVVIAGVALLGYGIYTLVAPEASISLGPLSVEAQDNTNSYITIGLGILILIIGLFFSKKK